MQPLVRLDCINLIDGRSKQVGHVSHNMIRSEVGRIPHIRDRTCLVPM